VQFGVGARGALSLVPSELESLYGGRLEPGAYLYLLASPPLMVH
jgi:hypothetical protein